MERVRLLLNPDPAVAREFVEVGIESFGVADLQRAVVIHLDLVPYFREWLQLDNEFVRPFAKRFLRIWWRDIYTAASNVPKLIEDVKRMDPEKGAILDSPEGRRWLNTNIYNLMTYFRAYGNIKDADGVGRPIAPPKSLLLSLARKSLGPPRRR